MQLCAITFFQSFGQQAAYYILGEDQFRGIQIYDVIQDHELNYWFATNEGMYYFNYTTYEKIECPKAKSNAVFNFIRDKNGVIYCHNLNNQIFKIENKNCSLFYELKDDEGGADVSLAIGDDGNLLVSSKKIIVLNAAAKITQCREVHQHYVGQPFTTPGKVLQYHLSSSDTILEYAAGKFTLKHLNSEEIAVPEVLKFMKYGTTCFAVDIRTKKTYGYDPVKYKLIELPVNPVLNRNESVRFYETSKGLWLAGTLPGVFYMKTSVVTTPRSILYEDYFISDIYVDAEGNTLLSTFDKGVLVIPDLQVPDVIHSLRDDPVTALYSVENGPLILGSSKGKLLNYDTGRITSFANQSIDVIKGSGTGELLVFDDGLIRGYNLKTHQLYAIHDASLKAVIFVNPREFYLGTNRGMVKVVWNAVNGFDIQHIPELNIRIHHMAWDPVHQLLYVSTADGLFVRNTGGETQKILLKGEELFPNGLHYSNGKVIASTRENGVVVLINGTVSSVILPKVDGKTVVLKKLIIHNNTIIATSANGFYQFDMQGKLLKSIHAVFGFSSKRVIDFTFHRGKLWVSHSGGVQQIDLDYFAHSIRKPLVRFDKILVNGNVSFLGKSGFLSSDQRKIQFVFSSPTLRNRELIHYHYRLIGSDTTWNVNPYEVNQITYNALSPGNYVFEVKTESQGQFSEVMRYSFEIASPFYWRWWFITLAIASFLGMVLAVYRRQLAIQNKKARQINELNASKLTAIQSQMNPHFIFNSLNSIQDLILKGDVEHSYSYITTFSNLVRRTLSYSEKDFIDFEQEIKLLELYLSLEKLRFKKDFNYTIHHNNPEDIMLPPLLVQPFIENALVHGLLHKEGMKQLTITFILEEVLICIVEDNGVGRERAKAIKMRQRPEHESFSGKAMHNRFEILSAILGGEFGYHYDDVMENGEVAGTRVTLRIPVKHRY